jgi:hypothetical protein
MEHCIIVGAQRSGTTYLYKVLDDHPEICMSLPIKPEPKYFLNRDIIDLNLEYYNKNYFEHLDSSQKICIEKSTSYYENEISAKLISELLPNAKIIFLLRNPVERALSNYFFSLNHGLETRTLEEVFIHEYAPPILKNTITSVNPFNYLTRGLYQPYIEIYKKYFSIDNMKILIFEEFVGDLKEVKKLYTYLGVEESYVPINLEERINTSIKNDVVSLEVIEKLKAFYKLPNHNLESLLSRDLSIWK